MLCLLVLFVEGAWHDSRLLDTGKSREKTSQYYDPLILNPLPSPLGKVPVDEASGEQPDDDQDCADHCVL